MSISEKQSRLLNECVDSLKDWVGLINTHLDGKEEVETRELAEEITKNYCSLHLEAEKSDAALKKVEDYISDAHSKKALDPDSLFKYYLQEDNTSSDHFNSEIWHQVFSSQSRDVEEVQRQTENLDESNYQEINDSVQYSEIFQLPVDPITKQNISDPYRNKVCGHVYEYKFILPYIKSMKDRAKCPYVGCVNRCLTVSDLIQDANLQRKIIQYSQQSTSSQSQ